MAVGFIGGVGGGKPSVKSVQKVLVTLLDTSSSLNATISEVDPQKSIIRIHRRESSGQSINSVAVPTFVNETTINISRGGGFGAYTITYMVEVIEYENVKSKSTGVVTIPNTSNRLTNYTIGAVNPQKSLLELNFKAAYNDGPNVLNHTINGIVTTPTNLQIFYYFTPTPSALPSILAYYQILEFK